MTNIGQLKFCAAASLGNYRSTRNHKYLVRAIELTRAALNMMKGSK